MNKQLRVLSVILFFSGLLCILIERAVSMVLFLPVSKGVILGIRFFLQALALFLVIMAHRKFRQAVPTGSNLGCYFLIFIFLIYIWSFVNFFGIATFFFNWVTKS